MRLQARKHTAMFRGFVSINKIPINRTDPARSLANKIREAKEATKNDKGYLERERLRAESK